MTQSPPPGPLSHISLAGVAVRVENVRLLADRLGDNELARKLERAVANDNSIVALSMEDRQRILDVLEQPPIGLAELRKELQSQLENHVRKERMRYGREAFVRRRATDTTRPPDG
jgi:hypothetical protein